MVLIHKEVPVTRSQAYWHCDSCGRDQEPEVGGDSYPPSGWTSIAGSLTDHERKHFCSADCFEAASRYLVELWRHEQKASQVALDRTGGSIHTAIS